jgi:hypothetical protein
VSENATVLLPPRAELRRMVPLFAGRGTYRLVIAVSNVVLATAWGPARFAGYAAAMGAFTVLSFLTALGVEKSALKLIPRARRTGPELITAFVLLPAVLGAGCLVWVAVVATDPLTFAAGALAIGLGANQVLVGLHRVQGRPGLDVANHVALVAGLVVTTLAAALGDLGPTAFVGWTVALVTGLNAALLVELRPRTFRTPRRAVLRAASGTSMLMSAGEVAAAAVVSLVFVVLAHSPHHEQAGALFLAVGVSSLLVKAFGYLLRVVQPQVSVALHPAGAGAAVRARSARNARLLVVAGTPYLIVVTALAVLAGRAGLAPDVVVLLVLYLACAPLIFGMGTINFLLENGGRAMLRRTAAGSVAGLAVAAPAAYLFISHFGAAGGLAAIALGELVHAAAVLHVPERTP